jgi:netrin-G3 ligand
VYIILWTCKVYQRQVVLVLVTSNILSFACCFSSALPGPPTNLRASEITATSVRLSWSYTGAEELQYYVIQFKPKYANQPYSEISGIITMYYTIRNLSPYTEYELFVIAVNNIGRGPPSTPVVVTTGETGEPIV